ncbi:hypothetical protein AB0E59_41245 [Lentzea sp. NPDC034063]
MASTAARSLENSVSPPPIVGEQAGIRPRTVSTTSASIDTGPVA